MKNKDVMFLVNAACFLNTTTYTLEPEDAYSLLKARKELSRVMENIEEHRRDCLAECELNTAEAQEALKDVSNLSVDIAKKLERFNNMYGACLEEEVVLNVRPVPYRAWHMFLKENKEITVSGITLPFKLGNLEWELEDIFWKAPEE